MNQHEAAEEVVVLLKDAEHEVAVIDLLDALASAGYDLMPSQGDTSVAYQMALQDE